MDQKTLEQPWKQYITEKAKLHPTKAPKTLPSDQGGDQELCPGSAECSTEEHYLGASEYCAFRSNNGTVEVHGSTGTSG